MSDTPISDSTAHNVAELGMLCRRLERELTASNAIIRQQQLLDEANLRLQERIKRLEDCIETAWGIIANVSGGDWTRQKPHWQEAVVRWRDNDFHPIMKELSERKAKEAKP
jgi:tryptophan 2,3-dioxygenase